MFFRCELEHEILGKTPDVAANREIEIAGCDPVLLSEVTVQQNLVSTDEVNSAFDEAGGYWQTPFNPHNLFGRHFESSAAVATHLQHITSAPATPDYSVFVTFVNVRG